MNFIKTLRFLKPVVFFLIFNTYSQAGAQNCHIQYFENNKWGIMNLNEEIIISPKFDSIQNYITSQNNIVVHINKKIGVIDTNNHYSIEPKYEYLFQSESSLDKNYIVSKNGRFGVISQKGKELEPLKYKFTITRGYIYDYSKKDNIITFYSSQEGTFKFNINGKRIKKKAIEESVAEHIDNTKKKEYPKVKIIEENNKFGLSIQKRVYNSRKSKWEIKTITTTSIYDSIHLKDKDKKIIYVQKNGLWGVMNFNTELIIPTFFDEVKIAFGKTYFAKRNSEWGVVKIGKNNLLSVELPFVYDSIMTSTDYWNFDYIVSQNNTRYLIPMYHTSIQIPIQDYEVIELKEICGMYVCSVRMHNGKIGQIGANGIMFFKE